MIIVYAELSNSAMKNCRTRKKINVSLLSFISRLCCRLASALQCVSTSRSHTFVVGENTNDG